MARAMLSDPYHNFRFHVTATLAGSLVPFGDVTAGFTAVTMPEKTVESVEYKEGTMVFRRKFPGDVTFGTITLSRGVAGKTGEFYGWAAQTSAGGQYRVDLVIHQHHRTSVTDEKDTTQKSATRKINCFEAFPVRYKPGSDLESTSSDISIQEIEVEVEYFTITNDLA